MKIFFAVALAFAGSAPTVSWATTRTVTLAVPGMTCPTCPITIKKSLEKVTGVEKTAVNFDKREALVTFDDQKTTTGALTQATTNVGYPSTVKP
jgi:mercuric ion binding protein